ncbi:MAG: hypothetical protein ACPHDM_03610, partial [Candidatus Poseidoniaceae archaeon]
MQEEVFEAEIVPDSGDNTLNITLGATFAIAVIFLLLGTNVGKVLDEEASVETTVPNWWEVPIHERYELDLYTPGQERSILPINGTLGVRTYTEHFIEVELPPSE